MSVGSLELLYMYVDRARALHIVSLEVRGDSRAARDSTVVATAETTLG